MPWRSSAASSGLLDHKRPAPPKSASRVDPVLLNLVHLRHPPQMAGERWDADLVPWAGKIGTAKAGAADNARAAWPHPDAGGPEAIDMLALALLQTLPSPRATGARPGHHPMGS